MNEATVAPTVPTGTPTRLTGTKSESVMPGNKASLYVSLKLAWPLLECVWLCRVSSVVQNYSSSECRGNSPQSCGQLSFCPAGKTQLCKMASGELTITITCSGEQPDSTMWHCISDNYFPLL